MVKVLLAVLSVIIASIGLKQYCTGRNKDHNPPYNSTLPYTEKDVNIMLKDVIMEERQKQGLSLSELARRSGHAVSSLHEIETGENRNPSYRTVADLCAALGLSLDELEQRIHPGRPGNPPQ